LILIYVFATCLVASSNYVLNEIQDAEFDKIHPKKKFRPIPSDRVILSIAYFEWVLFGVIGCLLAATVNRPFFYTIIAFLIAGIMYNVKPFRSKDIPYLDVLSESINNPLRLLLGWFTFVPNQFPSVSLLISYWMIGAFFMAIKRFAEIRNINDAQIAGSYRKSFNYYTETRLIASISIYITIFAFFLGVFVLKYHFELILSLPFIAGFIALYIKIGHQEDSAVQNPERLYKEKLFMVYAVVCFFIFIVLLFTNIPALYMWFNVQPPQISPLWTL
jgi:4-hydroxybenzoate polyprenyltransferase